jgi:hypothetical protein
MIRVRAKKTVALLVIVRSCTLLVIVIRNGSSIETLFAFSVIVIVPYCFPGLYIGFVQYCLRLRVEPLMLYDFWIIMYFK